MKVKFQIFYSTRMQFTAKVDDWGITSDSYVCSIDTAKEYAIEFMRRFRLDYIDCIDANTGELIFSADNDNSERK